LSEAHSGGVRQALAKAELVLASDLTLIECERVLIRAVTTGKLSESKVAGRRARLRQAAEHWTILGIGPDVVERARRPFPKEPIRTLDAIHLATAIFAQTLVGGISLLALDHSVRACGLELGFQVLPELEE
jgi:predicted nucleic acid-binding protein